MGTKSAGADWRQPAPAGFVFVAAVSTATGFGFVSQSGLWVNAVSSYVIHSLSCIRYHAFAKCWN
jgi:hypothetical protein